MAPTWDQMKPRTVYEKAVQDFTETAQQQEAVWISLPSARRNLCKC